MITFNIRTIFLSLFFIATFCVSNSFAHFGSKGPFGGTTTCMVAYDTTVYVGTEDGGVFETTNSKMISWRARPVGLKSGKITALAHTGKFLYAGTADSGIFIFNGFVGSDRNWNKVNKGLTNLKITSLVAINQTTLMAGTNGDGIFITTDEGANWTPINKNINYFQITSLVNGGNRVFQGSDDGVYYTTNNGLTWNEFNDENTKSSLVKAMSYNATTNELLVVNNNGFFKIPNAGTATAASCEFANANLPTGINIRSITNDGGNWYLATDKGVYSSPSNTLSWTSLSTGLKTNDVRGVALANNQIVCGTYQKGLFKAPVSFTTWTLFNANYNNIRTYSLVTGGVLFVVAATELGVMVSKDLATTFSNANNGLIDSLNVNDLTMAESILLAATKNGGVYWSADSGKVWSTINSGLVDLNVKKVFYSDNVKYAITSDGNVYSSPLNSTIWTSIQAGLPANVNPSSMAFYGSIILLSTYGDGVYFRSVSGGNWSQRNTGLTNLNVTSVAVLGSKIFAGTDGSGVFVSDITIVNWETTSSTMISHATMLGLNPSKIQALGSYYGYVFASYKGGLVATSDNGATWIAGGNQFNLPSFTDVNKISFVTTRVFVTTEDNGLYSNALTELPTVVSGVNSSTEYNSLVKIFPNPTKGQFHLDYSEVSNKVREVNIYNFSGKLMNSFAPQNEISVSYPQGIYFLEIVSENNERYFKKIVIE